MRLKHREKSTDKGSQSLKTTDLEPWLGKKSETEPEWLS